MLRPLATLLLCFGITACSVEDIPLLYKHEIQQGNVFTQDQLNQLEKGMSKRQVQFIMGSAAVIDTFHPDRWNYIYTLRPSKGEKQLKRTTLIFDNDQLVAAEGDLTPNWN